MKATRPIQALFLIAAVYDGALGAIFLIAPGPVFQWANVTPPNHWAYVQFPAALLIIFGLDVRRGRQRPRRQPEPDRLWDLTETVLFRDHVMVLVHRWNSRPLEAVRGHRSGDGRALRLVLSVAGRSLVRRGKPPDRSSGVSAAQWQL